MKTNEHIPQADPQDMSGGVDDSLVEDVWQELAGRVSHAQVRRLASEIAVEYQDASVQAFVPIFIRRKVLTQLEEDLGHH